MSELDRIERDIQILEDERCRLRCKDTIIAYQQVMLNRLARPHCNDGSIRLAMKSLHDALEALEEAQ